jgi:hypothetical protein
VTADAAIADDLRCQRVHGGREIDRPRLPRVRSMILYNGAGGGLGRYFRASASASDHAQVALRSRLEDTAGLRRELKLLVPPASDATLALCSDGGARLRAPLRGRSERHATDQCHGYFGDGP